MSWIQALGGLTTLFGGANSSREGRNQANQGYAQQNQAINNSGELYRRALQMFNDREAQGAYNADATLKLLGEMAAANLKTTDRNTAGQLATLGYRRGDSPFTQKAAQNSEAANFKLRGDLLQAQQAFDQKRMGDLGAVSNFGSQYNSLLTGIGGQNVAQGNQRAANAYSGIGSFIGSGGLDKIDWDFLKPRRSDNSYKLI